MYAAIINEYILTLKKNNEQRKHIFYVNDYNMMNRVK